MLALASAASLMVALDTLVVSTALSTIRVELNASLAALEWTVNAYNLSFAVLLMTGAALGDRFGRRRGFTVGLAIFVAGSAACALAPSVDALIAARAVQGAGAALVMPLGMALVSSAFAPDKRGQALGVYFGVTGLAVASGPVVGGAITEGLAWEWIFWLNVPLGLALLALIPRRMQESHGPDGALDLVGLGLVGVAAFGVVWGLVRGNLAGWGSAEVVFAFAAGVACLALFIAWERRVADPMLPLRFFRSRAFAAGNAAVFFAVASLFGAVFFLAQFLQTGLGYGPLDAGLRLLPWTLTLFFVAPLAGALVDRHGERPFMVAGLALQGTGMGWIALIAEPGIAYASMIAPLIIAGCGVSMTFPAGQNSVVGAVPPEAVGKAAGTNSTLRELGGVFGIALLVAVFAGAGGYGSPAQFVDGFAPALGVTAGLSFAGALVGLALPKHQLRPRDVVPGVELEADPPVGPDGLEAQRAV
ncbi:MFS transporter [Solirubrobacter deserti]|uniref:MFS transporter n=1 Tax=Solirubrobacter deserti TaxID=2282478 RepID=A0ABT4RF05_9ACTN|nr:MFS transporter [Solirubrobacter deserti]MDA0137103.1 MFS transporter [Solirubrobacter deserti]